MTDKEKLEAIKAEVYRRYVHHGTFEGVIAETREDECSSILDFIDSMQENPCDGCTNRKGCITCENGELRETMQKEPIYKDYRERYKRIAQSESFKEAYDGKSISDEKPVSEELEQAAVEAFKQIVDSDKNNFLEIFKAGAEWQKEKEYTCYEEAFEDGAKWKVENLWKPADGDDLPEIDREVIVFTQNFPDDVGMMSVAIAHRPNPDGWDGKSLSTGKVEHYTPKTYDKGGWNIPDVKYWLDVELPKEIEL